MERTEPALVPQWLKCTGNGASIHHSDDLSPSHYTRSRSFKSNNDKDSPRYLDGTNSRSNSFSNGSAKNPYSSFSRSHRDKIRDREKEKSLFDDAWGHDSTDPLASILSGRVERSDLKRSNSLGPKKPVEKLSQKAEDLRISGNGALSGANNHSIAQKAVFEKDFPALQTEDKQNMTGIKRVLSPGLTSAVQSLPVGNSGFLTDEKWTSALVEVPRILPNNGTAHSPVRQRNSTSGLSSTMAAALSQTAARVRAPQLPEKSREELAKKHLRLIPVTPSMTKSLVSSSVDKSKQPKIGARTNEITVASKVVHPQPHSAHVGNQSPFLQAKNDSASASHVGKFLVLKPGRDTVSPGVKAAAGSTSEADGEVANCQLARPAASTASKCSSMVSALENKGAAISVNSKYIVDKRSSQSLAKSRSEFFNLMRRKASSRASNIIQSDLNSTDPSAGKEDHAAMSPVLEIGNQVIHNGDSYNIPEKIKSCSDVGDDSFSGNGSVYPDEEEAAFLRSLGWEENEGDEEGLTEEEINAFYQEYMNRRPSLLGSSEPKFSISAAVVPGSTELEVEARGNGMVEEKKSVNFVAQVV